MTFSVVNRRFSGNIVILIGAKFLQTSIYTSDSQPGPILPMLPGGHLIMSGDVFCYHTQHVAVREQDVVHLPQGLGQPHSENYSAQMSVVLWWGRPAYASACKYYPREGSETALFHRVSL